MKKLAVFALVFGLALKTLSGADKQKIIFDTDLGGDIDDAFALSLVLISPEFDVLGIVLDQGNTPKRAQVACKMLYEMGRDDIPVVVGRETDDNISPQFQWAEGFTKLKPVRKSAADFIIENLKKYPNEVILFTVGPVPNMKDVIEKDPDVLKLAKHVYSMFGSFYMGYDSHPVPSAEWNVRADVSASKAFTSSDAPVTYAGLDITAFVNLGEEMRQQLWLYDSPLTNALESLYALWRNEGYARPDPTLYDVVAVGMVLWPELFETRKAFVKVIDAGYTVIDESKEPNCEIGMSIQKDEFLRRVMERYLQQNLHRQ